MFVLFDTFLLCSYVQSWIDTREVQSERANLTILFDRYIPTCLDNLRFRFKKITPVTDSSMIQTLCYLLEALLTPENTPPDTAKEVYELYFVFAAVWAFGGSMFQDQVRLAWEAFTAALLIATSDCTAYCIAVLCILYSLPL